MRNSSESAWWRETRQLALTAVVVMAAVALMPVLFAGHAGDRLFLGLRFGTFAGVVLAPLAALVVAVAFTARQRFIDRRHNVADS